MLYKNKKKELAFTLVLSYTRLTLKILVEKFEISLEAGRYLQDGEILIESAIAGCRRRRQRKEERP